MGLIRGVAGFVKRMVIGALAVAGAVFILFVLDLLFNEEPPPDEPETEPAV